MPQPELGRVFVSSAFRDLGAARETIGKACDRLGLSCALTETLPADPRPVEARLGEELDRCDIYVGVFDTHRGTILPDGRSITEWELDEARARGLRAV